jgi:dimethylhistidine N-methyltransferase
MDPMLEIIFLKPATPQDDFATEVSRGLSQSQKSLPCKFFYDREGSQLFEEITHLPEYYLTRTEEALIQQNLNALLNELPPHTALVELGGGSSRKTETFIRALLSRQPKLHFTMIDISTEFLVETAESLLLRFPQLTISAILSEYASAFDHWKNAPLPTPKVILFLGSNLGNFDPPEAIEFLSKVRETMTSEDRFILGVDMQKEPALLISAYNDSAGVTARFNKNLLARINRELGGNFSLEKFTHRAVYNALHSRIEMYLVSEEEQTVFIKKTGQTFSFRKGETIHTENSYKYSPEMLEEVLRNARLRPLARFTHETTPYTLCLLSPE